MQLYNSTPMTHLLTAIVGLSKAELGQTWTAKQDFHTALKLATQAGDVELKNSIKEVLRLLE